MTRALFTFLAIAAAVSILLPPATADAFAEGPDFYAVRDVRPGDALNIRAKPNARATIVGAIPFDARRIENEAETFPETTSDRDVPSWCKVTYRGTTGWVRCRHLVEDAE
jgi:hypothetical protein